MLIWKCAEELSIGIVRLHRQSLIQLDGGEKKDALGLRLRVDFLFLPSADPNSIGHCFISIRGGSRVRRETAIVRRSRKRGRDGA